MQTTDLPQAASAAIPIEIRSVSEVEFRRFRLEAPGLPLESGGTVSIFRTPAAWTNPSIVSRTIYYFHSGQADDRQLRDLGASEALQSIGRTQSLDSIQIVSPSIENSFLVGAHERWFNQDVQAWCEAGTATSEHGRWISGVSMGGFVALSCFLSQPSRYAGVAANAPALLNWNFFDPDATAAQEELSGIPAATAAFLADFFSRAFGNHAEYLRRDPLTLLSQLPASALSGKAVYHDVGGLDDLGLHKTSLLLDQGLRRLQPKRYQFDVVPDGHHDPAFMRGQLLPTLWFVCS